MASNLSGVSATSANLDTIAIDDPRVGKFNYRALNELIGQHATTPDGELTSGNAYGSIEPRDPNSNLSMDALDVEGEIMPQQMKPQMGEPTQLQASLQPEGPVGPTSPLQQIANRGEADAALNEKRFQMMQGARAGAALIRMTGGIINANSKYSQIVSQNNYNIHLAEIQSLNVASSSAYNQVREINKGKSRADSSRINAVAQGQAAYGDLANTQASNEEVYSAQNAMNMQINATRQIFGIESQQRQLESSNRAASINRDAEINQAIIQGISGIGLSVMGGGGKDYAAPAMDEG